MRGTVYLLKNSGGYSKIGLTTLTHTARVRQLNAETGSDGLTKLVAFAEVDDCEALEYMLHGKFKDKRLSNPSGRVNEWFNLNDRDIIEIQNILFSKAKGEHYTPRNKEFQRILEVEKREEQIKKFEKIRGERGETVRSIKKDIKDREFIINSRKKDIAENVEYLLVGIILMLVALLLKNFNIYNQSIEFIVIVLSCLSMGLGFMLTIGNFLLIVVTYLLIPFKSTALDNHKVDLKKAEEKYKEAVIELHNFVNS